MGDIGAIVLDFDGVLAESNEEKTHAFEELFALYPAYRDAMMEYHLAHYSHPRSMKFEHYVYELMGRPDDVEMAQVMARQFSEFVLRRVVACPEVPGAQAFLAEFSQKVPLYISSVTPQDELRKVVSERGLGLFFVDIFGDPPCKKTEAIQEVLKREGLLPAELVFIGDSQSDYQVAMEADVEFIARNSGLPFDADGIELYRDLYEIAEVVRKRLKG
jgi:phosphoglycolate phosphatase